MLNNAGGFAYRDGRWKDAMTLYVQGAEASARSGNSANAAFGDCNVGELLSDQGHWDEAEMLLRRARQVWRATGYEWGVAYATAQLGRLAARSGHEGQALTRLLDALARFRALGVEGDVQFAEALLAEAAAFAGDGDTAQATADRLLAGPDAGLLEPLLHRVKAFALAQRGDVEGCDGRAASGTRRRARAAPGLRGAGGARRPGRADALRHRRAEPSRADGPARRDALGLSAARYGRYAGSSAPAGARTSMTPLPARSLWRDATHGGAPQSGSVA